ncbi:Tetratricopeptide repeat protein [Aquisphaera giovannonii]|uniref:Tetratricopeptide repeat protein n=1 Tax=Aquisphaera giovannonii TaxID=406548 RepID=A0A5B9W0V1_9BACT|nr:tetratricopeptide repeat protein [Aquisphaera giovannonii]QEH33844.1 Tetratricopeptide repeat protein [Aquisphaera giovannonii]
MQTIAIPDGETRGAADGGRVDDESPECGRTDRITAWMIALGTATLVCAFGDAVVAFLEWRRLPSSSWRTSGLFFREQSPLLVVGMCWPLLIALLARGSQGGRYLPMAALTFFAMSLGGVWNIVQAIAFPADGTLIVGSFSIPAFSLARGSPSAWTQALLGMAQLATELFVAIAAWLECRAWPARLAPDSTFRDRVRGRLAFYLTLAFLLVCIRVPIWSGYVALVNRSASLRSYVLTSGPAGRTAGPGVGVGARDPGPVGTAPLRLGEARRLAEELRDREAAAAYEAAITLLDGLAKAASPPSDIGATLALASNNLAWLLATCEDQSVRNPAEAVRLAERAVELAEDEGTYWNTLGAAYCRMGRWEEARRALSRSMELRTEQGDAFDWFFLAIVEWHRGHEGLARWWYEKAVEWTASHRPRDRELRLFREEASKLLRLPATPSPPDEKPGPTPPAASTDAGPTRP